MADSLGKVNDFVQHGCAFLHFAHFKEQYRHLLFDTQLRMKIIFWGRGHCVTQ